MIWVTRHLPGPWAAAWTLPLACRALEDMARLTAPGEWSGKLSRLVVFHSRTRPFSLVAPPGSSRKMET